MNKRFPYAPDARQQQKLDHFLIFYNLQQRFSRLIKFDMVIHRSIILRCCVVKVSCISVENCDHVNNTVSKMVNMVKKIKKKLL